MLSIIVSSYQKENLTRLKNNIEITAGVPVQFIPVLNEGVMSLCEAYNKGAKKAVFSCLCFVHDDVLFHTPNWGDVVLKNLNDLKTGVVGVMGGRYKSANGLGWRDGKTEFYRMTVISGSSGGRHLVYNPHKESKSQVLCLDGAFLCCRKSIWEQFKFDADNFKGFHFYDIDFSFRVSQQFENYVLFEILLEHFSSGKFDEHYLNDSMIFDKKHRKILPYTIENLSYNEINQLEGYMLSEKLIRMKEKGFPLRLRLQLINRYFSRYRNFYQLIRNLYFGLLKA